MIVTLNKIFVVGKHTNIIRKVCIKIYWWSMYLFTSHAIHRTFWKEILIHLNTVYTYFLIIVMVTVWKYIS